MDLDLIFIDCIRLIILAFCSYHTNYEESLLKLTEM